MRWRFKPMGTHSGDVAFFDWKCIICRFGWLGFSQPMTSIVLVDRDCFIGLNLITRKHFGKFHLFDFNRKLVLAELKSEAVKQVWGIRFGGIWKALKVTQPEFYLAVRSEDMRKERWTASKLVSPGWKELSFSDINWFRCAVLED